MLSWIDNFNMMGPREIVMKGKKELKGLFEMKDVVEMMNYVGCKNSQDWYG